MNIVTKQIYCSHCKETRMGQRASVNHVLHVIILLIVSAVTCGWGGIIWLLVWLIDACIKLTKPYQCPVCGTPESGGSEPLDKNLLLIGVGIIVFVVIVFILAALAHH